MYYNARYYDPDLGQFLSPDTLVPDPTSVFGYNRYMYTSGNPMNRIDPSGHSDCPLSDAGDMADLGGDNVAVCAAGGSVQMGGGFSGGGALPAEDGFVEIEETGQAFAKMPAQNSATTGQNGIISGQTSPLVEAANAEASLAQMTTPAKLRPGAAGALEVNGQIFTAQSVKGGQPPTLNPQVQKMLDSVDPVLRSKSHGFCAEPQCVSQALDAGVDPRGGTSYVVDVRAVGNPMHGAPKPACPSCELLLQYFGITDGTR